ncbi:MAG: protein phosphatase 2C domain-containing protein [Nannocystaceae bacterium]
MELSCSASNHIGRRRDDEDAHAVRPDLGLAVVADGMGGYEGGEVASRIVVGSLVELFGRTQRDPEATWPHAPRPTRDPLLDRVGVGLRHAHARVLARRRGRLSQMGSTAVVVAWSGTKLAVGHVGDSRVYRLGGGRLQALTRDHSFVEEARRAGLPEDAAVMASHRHVLTRAIGMPGPLEADLHLYELSPGDVLLLCSDGVWEPLCDEHLRAALALPPAEAASTLVAWAYEAGGCDNMTALVLRVPG